MTEERPDGAGDIERTEGTGEPERDQAERGSEAYGGDPDAEPSVTEAEVETGLERDQAEG